MSLKNPATAVVIALGSADKEQRQKEKLESTLKKPLEFHLCEGQPSRALRILQECRVSRWDVLFYTDWEVAYKYSKDPNALIQAAAQIVSNSNIFVI